MQEYGERFFQCLPADTADDVRKRMNKELGVRWTAHCGMVYLIISEFVRRHSREIGFTVPHVRRGKPDLMTGWFFAVLVEEDGSFYFDDEHRGHLSTRSSIIANLARQTTNLRAIVATCKQYERSARRDYLDELEENFRFRCAKRSARILKFMDNQAA